MDNNKNSFSSITEQFRAVGRLLNEWRDTLSYAVLTAFAISNVLHSGQIDFSDYIFIMSVREFTRSLAWAHSNPKAIAGYNTPKIDIFKFRNAALSGAFLLLMPRTAIVLEAPRNLMLTGLSAVCSVRLAHDSGGLKGVASAYQTMWDWPRKRGGGGTTQTERFMNSIRSLFGKAADAMACVLPKPLSRLDRVQPGLLLDVPKR